MSKRFLSTIAVAALVSASSLDPASAGTCSSLTVQPNSTRPKLTGQLVFEATSGGASHIFYFDFAKPATAPAQIDPPATFSQAFNPVFSPNGKWIAFYGATPSCGSSQTIYLYNIAQKKISTLIACDATSSQDIRFSPDQQKVVFKRLLTPTSRNIVYAPLALNATTGTATIGAACNITNDTTEHSAPWFSASGKYVYYFNNATTAANIYRSVMNASCAAPGAAAPVTAPGNSAFYPVARDLTTLLYTRRALNSGAFDQVFTMAPDTNSPSENQLDLDDCNYNNNDAASVDENYIIFSRGMKTQSLFVGNIAKPLIWSLSSLLTGSFSDLKAAGYTANR